ncbi:MAG TPA: hypothetical protein VFY93_00510 [Planctomycetota bacterium]|nr:hypothetical protein [Planctomycetota bacterium]
MRFLPCCLALLPLACAKEDTAKKTNAAPPPIDLKLAADPGETLSVKEAKEKGSGEEVVVLGRISNVVKGLAIFNLVDASLDYCGGTDPNDSCPQPWDYCCIAAADRAAATLAVELRGPDGKVLARGLPSLRLLDLVAVKGKLEKDDHGNVTVVATGWFTRERPKLRDGLHWPE